MPELPQVSLGTLATSVSIAGGRVQIAPSSDDLVPADGLTLAGTRAYAWVPPETPTLDVLPHDRDRTFPGAAGTSFDGRQYFIPMARIATRNPTSRVPAVWVEPVGAAWSVRFTLQLYWRDGVPADAIPLDLDVTVNLRSPHGVEAELRNEVAEPPSDPSVIRQFSVSAPVDRAVIDLLRTQPRMTISVSGVPHFGYSALAVQAEVVAQSQGDVAWEPDRVFVGLPDLPAYFPASERANLTIYAALDGIPGSDPGAWVIGPAGPWCRSAPGEFFTLPHEYRLAADTEHGVPAVNVLLLPPSDTVAGAPAAGMAAAGGAAASSYRVRVRVRFEVMPWWDPIQLAQLRTDIAETTATTYPELAIGGYASADFTPPSLLQHLGGDVLGAETSAIDANGFELVLDCSMEFYTLLCTLLAPPTGTPSGLEAHVRFTLTGGLEAPLTRDIPVRIRLDVLAGGFLPLTLVPNDTSPADPGAVDPGVQAKVRNMIGSTVDVEGAIATLLVAPGPGKPEGYPAAARAVPLPLRLGPAGGEADSAVLTLTPEAVVDPQAIAALDVQFTGIRLTDPPVSVLERVHELAASTSQPTSVRVTSYQLAHPDNLPASLADLYGIEVEVRIGTRPAVTAFLTRTEPDKTIGLALLIGDLVAGADPQQPSFEWRRRNLATSGTGEFSIWQTTSGRELFVTPTDPAT